MNDFSLTTVIARQPATVFAFIAEPANMPRWYDAVDHVTASAGEPVGLGATFEIIRSLPGGRATNIVEIADYEPGRRITFDSRRGPTPFRYTYTLEPEDRGTQLTLQGRISSAGLAGPAAHLGGVATILFKHGMKRNLDVLKDVLECEPSEGSCTGEIRR